jgi:preprotein translocase subunit SecD
MNRYPLWKYVVLVAALVFGFLYTLPNFYGESPAVQVSSSKATIKIDNAVMTKVLDTLNAAGVANTGAFIDTNGVKIRFADTDTQIKAKDTIDNALNTDKSDPTYVVALNLLSASPNWLTAIHALPMYLGLDLRGGIHILLQVDMRAALTKKVESMTGDLRSLLRDKNIRHSGIAREGQSLVVRFRDVETRDQARDLVRDSMSDLDLSEAQGDGEFRLVGVLKPAAQKRIQDYAIKQNISTLHNRINELGVTEPIVQQQGVDRVVVQLPGVQDMGRVNSILGRTATLELRMVDETGDIAAALRGQVPFGEELYTEHGGVPLLVKKHVELTGDQLTDAQPGFDNQTQEPAVHLKLDAKGTRVFRDLTRENVGKRMAILLIEKNKGEVVTAPVIRSEIGGGSVQISGRMTTVEANDVALLLRAGSLAAPMEIIEQRVIGPSLGAENIAKGITSTEYGFAAIALFMIVYYLIFGTISVIALVSNLLFLVALLSLIQATLTLPGIAAIALALGMAIDANVLINERVREELRNGATPQAAIYAGYDRAFGTIFDSNFTTLIVGLALLTVPGAVRGFAVVHCLGIATSMFSAVFLSRGIVNIYYGSRRKLDKISIGQVWKPDAAKTAAAKA